MGFVRAVDDAACVHEIGSVAGDVVFQLPTGKTSHFHPVGYDKKGHVMLQGKIGFVKQV